MVVNTWNMAYIFSRLALPPHPAGFLFCNPKDYSLPASFCPLNFQAKILQWVAVSYSSGPFWSREWTSVSCISRTGKWIPYLCTTREAQHSALRVRFKVPVVSERSLSSLITGASLKRFASHSLHAHAYLSPWRANQFPAGLRHDRPSTGKGKTEIRYCFICVVSLRRGRHVTAGALIQTGSGATALVAAAVGVRGCLKLEEWIQSA